MLKKIVIMCFGVIFLAGCTRPDNTIFVQNIEKDGVSATTATRNNQPIVDEPIVEEASVPEKYSVYRQWFIPLDPYDSGHDNLYFTNYSTKDCIGLLNGQTYGGDLLSSLIADKKARDLIMSGNLDIYSPDYLAGLESKIAKYTLAQFDSNYYAFYVCHLGDGIDLSAGYLWPKDKKMPVFNIPSDKEALILVSGDRVIQYPKIRTQDATATGGETAPCTAKLEDKAIVWTCFSRLNEDPDTHETYGTYANYLLSLEGQIVKTWNSRD